LLGVKVVGDCDVVVFRGSKTFEDWLPDFDVLANPFVHSKISPVHRGFLGLDQVFQEYQQYHQQGSGKLLVCRPFARRPARFDLFCACDPWPASFPPGGSYSASHVRDFGPLATLISSIKEGRGYRNGNFAGMPR